MTSSDSRVEKLRYRKKHFRNIFFLLFLAFDTSGINPINLSCFRLGSYVALNVNIFIIIMRWEVIVNISL